MSETDAGSELRRAVALARAQPDAMQTVGRLYDDLARAVAERKPRCTASGRCCRFEAYGHRMYVSTIELARFVTDLESTSDRPDTRAWDGTGCPFQIGGLCGVHAVRPLGCRTFYCDPTSTEWQNALYERHHDELRTLHDQTGVPYRYLEWRSALRELGLADNVPPASYSGPKLTVGGKPLGR